MKLPRIWIVVRSENQHDLFPLYLMADRMRGDRDIGILMTIDGKDRSREYAKEIRKKDKWIRWRIRRRGMCR